MLSVVGAVSLVVMAVVVALVWPWGGRVSPGPSARYSSPIIRGLQGRHPLDQRQVGEVLLRELGCAACHTHPRLSGLDSKAAPDLSDVGRRVAPEYLRRYIADPASAQTGTTMPQVLTGQLPGDRAAIADAISQFLVSRSSAPFRRDTMSEREFERGRLLFHTVGCVACHEPREPAFASSAGTLSSDLSGDLAYVSEKYSLESLSQFLYEPLVIRPSGRMPDMGLDRSEAAAIASYLLGAPDETPLRLEPSADLAEQGRGYFESFNCASCHVLEGVEQQPPMDLGAASAFERGCLAPRPEVSPEFHLDDSQRLAIIAALTADAPPPDARTEIAAQLTVFGCIACHERGEYGGASAEIDPYFQSSEPSLGNEARIPPPLTDVGDKLQSAWLHKVLFDGARVRPYMLTRMPRFGQTNLPGLVELFEQADRHEYPQPPELHGDAEREHRDAGRLLVGTDGLGCVVCHGFNGKESPGFHGLDLITAPERLRYGWFAQFLLSPQESRPGIIMPQNWPGGVAARTEILGGETQAQIHAIWSFLAQGRVAQDPVGVQSEPTTLAVTDTPRLYRGRSRIAGFRGIAIGFPEGLHYAFDAEMGSLTAIWTGDFVRVRWDGQGAGDFDPVGRAAALPRDVGLLALDSDEATWPARPVMTEEDPVNPDPLYPRRLGYRFEGYLLDGHLVPTLRYRLGDVAVQDRSVVEARDERPMLVRSLRLTAPAPQTLYLRLLTGDIEQASPTEFSTSDVRMTTTGGLTLLRQPYPEESQHELLLRLDLEKGDTTVVITYELLW